MAMTSQTISSGMICIDKTIGYEDAIIVNSGGTAINTTVNLGLLKISSGGLASNANAFFGGWINVLAGGTAYRIVENGGNVIVEDGAVVCGDHSAARGLANDDAALDGLNRVREYLAV